MKNIQLILKLASKHTKDIDDKIEALRNPLNQAEAKEKAIIIQSLLAKKTELENLIKHLEKIKNDKEREKNNKEYEKQENDAIKQIMVFLQADYELYLAQRAEMKKSLEAAKDQHSGLIKSIEVFIATCAKLKEVASGFVKGIVQNVQNNERHLADFKQLLAQETALATRGESQEARIEAQGAGLAAQEASVETLGSKFYKHILQAMSLLEQDNQNSAKDAENLQAIEAAVSPDSEMMQRIAPLLEAETLSIAQVQNELAVVERVVEADQEELSDVSTLVSDTEKDKGALLGLLSKAKTSTADAVIIMDAALALQRNIIELELLKKEYSETAAAKDELCQALKENVANRDEPRCGDNLKALQGLAERSAETSSKIRKVRAEIQELGQKILANQDLSAGVKLSASTVSEQAAAGVEASETLHAPLRIPSAMAEHDTREIKPVDKSSGKPPEQDLPGATFKLDKAETLPLDENTDPIKKAEHASQTREKTADADQENYGLPAKPKLT